ncbi:carph-isopro domain-containing protein [Tabrizicola thermarum]|uniref:carph-isopro domain-containing protein n=1 Tax=Tabrizicola thermarum TaxID=2670345 RepID=UPI000FFB6665|nr:hypothetical protein [Tabrizicola thermarum]
MSYVDVIVSKFGGLRRMALLLERPVSTVQSWKARGSIPDNAKPSVLARAKALGIDLRPEHFFPGVDRGPAA